MAAATKRCRIHYRRRRRDGANLPPATFSELISRALSNPVAGVAVKERVDLRIMPTSPQGPAQIVLNDLDRTLRWIRCLDAVPVCD